MKLVMGPEDHKALLIRSFELDGEVFPNSEISKGLYPCKSYQTFFYMILDYNPPTLSQLRMLYKTGLSQSIKPIESRDSSLATVVECLGSMFGNPSLGEITNDIVVYNGDGFEEVNGAQYLPVQWIKNPERTLVEKRVGSSNLYQYEGETIEIYLPPSGFIMPTDKGFLDSVTGAPFETYPCHIDDAGSKSEFELVLEREGFALNSQMYFKRERSLYKKGASIVVREQWREDVSAFGISVGHNPGGSYWLTGCRKLNIVLDEVMEKFYSILPSDE
tara:strand:+ start:226 stop:1050 length:825 start_codon:yes stop_codon:yes gene_type:complete